MDRQYKKVQVPTPNGVKDALEIPVEESLERWSDITLADGTIFRCKMTVVSIARIEGQYDELGQPVYIMNAQPTIALLHTPEALKKKGSPN